MKSWFPIVFCRTRSLFTTTGINHRFKALWCWLYFIDAKATSIFYTFYGATTGVGVCICVQLFYCKKKKFSLYSSVLSRFYRRLRRECYTGCGYIRGDPVHGIPKTYQAWNFFFHQTLGNLNLPALITLHRSYLKFVVVKIMYPHWRWRGI